MGASAIDPVSEASAAGPAGTLFSRSALLLVIVLGSLAFTNNVLLPWLAVTLSRHRLAIGSLGLTGLWNLILNDADGNAVLRIQRVYVTFSPMWLFRWGTLGGSRSPTRPITIAIDGVNVVTPAKKAKEESSPAPDDVPDEPEDLDGDANVHETHTAAHTEADTKMARVKNAFGRLKQGLLLAGHYALPFVTAFFGIEVRDISVLVPELDVEARVAYVQLRADVTLAYSGPPIRALAAMILEEPGDDFAPANPHAARKRMQLKLPSGRARIVLRTTGIVATCDGKQVFRSRDSHKLALHAPIGHYTAKESVQVFLRLAESMVDLPELLQIAGRTKSGSPRPKPKRRAKTGGPSVAARLLEKLASFEMTLPMLHVSGKIPDSTLSLSGELRNMCFTLNNSDLSHFVHQSWFGACGVKGHKMHRHSRVPILEEWRRIFYARLNFDDISAHCVDDRTGLESLLVHASALGAWTRSSYTPFGLFSAKEHTGAPKYLELDPNEHAMVSSLTLGEVRGAILAEHAAALSAALSSRPPRPRRESAPKPLVGIPRAAFLVNVPRVVYVVHEDVKTMGEKDDVALVLSMQNTNLMVKPQYVERGFDAPTPLAIEATSAFRVDDVDVYCSARSSHGVSHIDILHVHEIQVDIAASAPVTLDDAFVPHIQKACNADMGAYVGLVEVDFWHPTVLELLSSLASRFAPVRTHTRLPPPPKPTGGRLSAPSAPLAHAHGDMHGPHNSPTPLLHRIIPCSISLSIARTAIFIGGSDQTYDPNTSRGLCVELAPVCVQFTRAPTQGTPSTPNAIYTRPQDVAVARKALGLPPDAQAHVLHEDSVGACGLLTLHGITVYPLVDIAHAVHMQDHEHVRGAWMDTDRPSPQPDEGTSVYSRSVWNFDSSFSLIREPRMACKLHQLDPDSFVAHIPRVSANALIHEPDAALQVLVSCTVHEKIRYRAQLTHLYCVLVALGSMRRVASSFRPKQPPLSSKDDTARPDAPNLPPRKPTVQVRLRLRELHVAVVLPNGHDLLLVTNEIETSVHGSMVRVSLDRARAYVHSPQNKSMWELMLDMRNVLVVRGEQNDPSRIFVHGDCLQIHIPFGYYTHGIVEGTLVFIKASKQLVHQLVKGKSGSAIYPHAEDAKRLPHMSVRFRVISLEAGDEPFESKLGMLLHVGRDEQLSRMERESLYSSYSAQRSPVMSPAVDRVDTHDKLDEFNATNWIRRIHNAREQESAAECEILSYILKQHVTPSVPILHGDLPIDIVSRAHVPPLMRALLVQVALDISPPTGFALKDTHLWLHEQSGNPIDTLYTALVPLHLRWRMSEASLVLRNYPIPLLSVPPLSEGQPLELDNWDAEGDLCIAEQLGTKASIRYVPATIVPAVADTSQEEHGILVPKNAVAKKFYGELKIKINTHATTVFCWGQSIQPAIQALTRVFDSLTSPPHDPSPRLGPWDKIPLALQARILFEFSGDVQLFLRGSRDPFAVDGIAAGWAMIWQSPTQLRLMFPNADGENLQLISSGHLLAVPDISRLESSGIGLATDVHHSVPGYPMLNRSDRLHPLKLSKIVWRLCGTVHWGIGIITERTCRDDTCELDPPCRGPAFHRRCRFFGRRPHWEVVGRTREGVEALPPNERRDTFEGWRSDFLHLSVSIESVTKGAGVPLGQLGPTRVNRLYITPAAWDHFMAWIRLFNSRLSLPIRQGPVFPQITSAKKPKFGKHLATIKYRFNIAPLVGSHMLYQLLRHDICHGIRTHVGIRAQVSSLHLDLHQRMQETVYEHQGQVIHAFHKPLYEIEADITGFFMHVLGARFFEPWGAMPDLAQEQERYDLFGDLFQHARDAPDEPLYDLDDYVELGMVPSRGVPRIVAHEFLRCPHANFHRIQRKSDIERKNTPSAPHPESKFGNEPTHTCLIGEARKRNKNLIMGYKDRIRALDVELEELRRRAHVPMTSDVDHQALLRFIAGLEQRRAALKKELDTLLPWPGASIDDWTRLVEEWDKFVDHVYVLSPTVLIHSGIWGLLERFLASMRLNSRMKSHLNAATQRIVYELAKANRAAQGNAPAAMHDASAILQDLSESIEKMASFGIPIPTEHDKFGRTDDKLLPPDTAIADKYAVHRTMICVCENPQLILHSDLDTDATMICYSTIVRSRTYNVRNSTNVESEGIARDMLDRHYLNTYGLQVYYINASKPDTVLPRPPTLEQLHLDPETLSEPTQHSRVTEIVPATDMYIHFDKHNKMCPRDGTHPLVAADSADTPQGAHLRDHTDLFQVRAKRFTLRANSEQYAALYNIVTRVLMHHDPMEREMAKRLDTLLYSHMFEDPELVVQAVCKLQRSIHQLLNRQSVYRSAFDRLNQHGRREFVRTQVDLYALVEELVLFHVAVGMAGNNRAKERHLAMQVQAYVQQIEWMMLRSHEENLFARLALERVAIARLNLANLTSVTAAAVGDIVARNAHPGAYFQDIITRHTPSSNAETNLCNKNLFISVAMLLLPPVGGISVMDYFKLHIHPVRVQLEIRVGHQLMDYLFGTKRQSTTQKEKKRDKPSHRWLRRLQKASGSCGNSNDDTDTADTSSDNQSDLQSSPGTIQSDDGSDSSDNEEIFESSLEASLESPTDASFRPTRLMRQRGEDEVSHGIILDSIVREMARRAASNLAFIRVVMDPTSVCLSFKGDSDFVLTDLFDLEFQMPRLQYLNIVGAFGDLADLLKKDLIRIAWNNRATLIKGVISTNSKKRAALRKLRNYRLRQYSQAEWLDPANQLEMLSNDSPHADDQDSDSDSLALTTVPSSQPTITREGLPDSPSESAGRRALRKLVPDRILQLRRSRH
ncbi:hypothetical protein MCUN1_001191 [Malassezia cuniculi]|uniref:Uncharacterized protein n=1 Tax=Malassezia cuniculi TaxID=948313 RepID=A0AAF0ETN7_9BASI|nr:hypothetical protein MCUN1_001191 [Malassezia cuniculi]